MKRARLTPLVVCLAAALACSDDSAEGSDSQADETGESSGDGDGDPSGDGDGDPSGDGDGDGDGDPSGDGDGDPSGDGDGDPSGDGDGDPSGDGDADGDCLDPGQPGPVEFEPVDVPLSEFFSEPGYERLFDSVSLYELFFDDAQPPGQLGQDWLLFTHEARRPLGTFHAITDVENKGTCRLGATIGVTRLAANCDNFSYERVGPASALFDAPFFEADSSPEVNSSIDAEFDCEQDGLGEFADCTEAQWCAPGLICAGITRASSGLCMDASLRGEFESGAVNLAIPAGDALIDTLEATELATVDTDVVVYATIQHPDPSALTITLTNPDGNEVMVWDQEPSPYDLPWYEGEQIELARVPQGFSGDESVNGTWTLTITDAGGQGGTLLDWGLEIMSRFD